jgi:hypothetical protein
VLNCASVASRRTNPHWLLFQSSGRHEHAAKGLYALRFATMPNGLKYDDWLKSKGWVEDGENRGPWKRA